MPSALDLAAFIAKYSAKSVCQGWNPVWLLKTRKRAVRVAFNDIANPRRLIRISRLCELHYMQQIERDREAFCKHFAPRMGRGKALMEFERDLCRRDLYYLAKYVLGYDRMVFHLHYFMAESVSDMPKGYRGLREFPRDSYKSTVMVVSLLVQLVLKDPNVRLLIKSNAEPNAGKKLCEAKEHFCNKLSPVAQLFPEHVPQRASDKGKQTEWTTPAKTSVQQEATYTAAGVGTRKVSQHYHHIIGDDFWDNKSVTSPEVMAKCRADMGELQYLLIAPEEGWILFIGTRFAHDDPTTDLMEDPQFDCIIVSGLMPNGRSIFPEQMSVVGFFYQSSKLYIFSCQIMLNPTDEERGFSRGWFGYARPEEWKAAVAVGEMAIECVVVTDFTGTGAANSDYAAAAAVLINDRSQKLVAEYVREKLTPLDFIKVIYALADKWGARSIIRQNAPLENSVSSFIENMNLERRKKGLAYHDWAKFGLGKKSKEMRMLGLQPMYQAGEILHNPDMANLDELEREILAFPHNQTNDDGMDALSELTDGKLCYPPRLTVVPKKVAVEPVSIESVKRREVEWRKAGAARAYNLEAIEEEVEWVS